MTRDESGSTDAAAAEQIAAATAALQLAVLEAGLAYPQDHTLTLRRLVQLLQTTQELVDIASDHAAATLLTPSPVPREELHLIHLDRHAQLLKLARSELITSCWALSHGKGGSQG